MGYSFFKCLLDKILKETDQYKTLTFAGIGEPLLDPSLTAKIKYASDRGLKVLLVTNGGFLHIDKFIELQDMGLYSVRVSFHGATSKGYSSLHGVPESQFQIIKSNIHQILKYTHRRTQVLLTCVYVEGINEDTIEAWIKLWDPKPNLMEVWRAHNWVNEFKYREIQEKKRRTCGRVTDGPLQVQVDGTINACCFDWDGKLVFGDLKTQRLAEIFSSMEYDKIAWCHETGDYESSNLICRHCDQRNLSREKVCLYSTKFDVNRRTDLTSTAYEEVT